jgi:hypothetical protein
LEIRAPPPTAANTSTKVSEKESKLKQYAAELESISKEINATFSWIQQSKQAVERVHQTNKVMSHRNVMALLMEEEAEIEEKKKKKKEETSAHLKYIRQRSIRALAASMDIMAVEEKADTDDKKAQKKERKLQKKASRGKIKPEKLVKKRSRKDSSAVSNQKVKDRDENNTTNKTKTKRRATKSSGKLSNNSKQKAPVSPQAAETTKSADRTKEDKKEMTARILELRRQRKERRATTATPPTTTVKKRRATPSLSPIVSPTTTATRGRTRDNSWRLTVQPMPRLQRTRSRSLTDLPGTRRMTAVSGSTQQKQAQRQTRRTGAAVSSDKKTIVRMASSRSTAYYAEEPEHFLNHQQDIAEIRSLVDRITTLEQQLQQVQEAEQAEVQDISKTSTEAANQKQLIHLLKMEQHAYHEQLKVAKEYIFELHQDTVHWEQAAEETFEYFQKLEQIHAQEVLKHQALTQKTTQFQESIQQAEERLAMREAYIEVEQAMTAIIQKHMARIVETFQNQSKQDDLVLELGAIVLGDNDDLAAIRKTAHENAQKMNRMLYENDSDSDDESTSSEDDSDDDSSSEEEEEKESSSSDDSSSSGSYYSDSEEDDSEEDSEDEDDESS